MKGVADSTIEVAEQVFRDHGGTMRTGDALNAGIHPRTLYAMRDAGLIQRITRGLHRLVESAASPHPDLVCVALRLPDAVICLVSALAFQELTTQIPHHVDVALPRSARTPRIEYPPVATYRFSGRCFSEGIETHDIGGIPVRVYGAEKTIADCFKFRSLIGLDIALEALRAYRRRKAPRFDDLMHFAAIDRVESVIRPYLETML